MLHIHRADRADGLVEALRGILAEPPEDPFAPEVVSVPTRGIERWLTQRLSAGLGATPGGSDGVCANVEFPPPHDLVGAAVAAASGLDPEEDPWRPERAVWPLLEVVEERLHEPALSLLASHLGDPDDTIRRARRFSTLRHVADLFDRYALHRPQMVRAWARGECAGWQPELWRRLRERLEVPDPAERLEAACRRLEQEPGVAALPERASVFGLTRLPAGHLAVLRALAAARDVHLFLLHPSPALWRRVAEVVAERPAIRRRAEDPTAGLPRNPLLASWGQDARELQLVVAAGRPEDHHHRVEHSGGTLLARLQADVREDRPPPGTPLPGHADERPLLDPGDRSVQIHSCHGRARQVEVLRDAVLHLLEDDPGLEPRDVIVMCPDIETFAPLIHATFGAGGPQAVEEVEALPEEIRPPDLRVRLADRALRQTNPVLGVVAHLLELADQRLTASQVLDLADRGPVRRRFRLDDDDLTRLQDWVAKSGIRWGLDAEHRAPFKLDGLPTGTWSRGLDRVLVGVAMTEEDRRRFGEVLPLDDVESGVIDLAGRVAELVDRLGEAVDALAAPKPPEDWARALADAAEALTATAPREAWQRAELQRLLDDMVAEGAGAPVPVALPEVRSLLGDRLRGRPTRANFRTGHLTICTLMPMRSVPHRVVCLLGLDDGLFPRKAPRDGDDLMLDDPHVGDRHARSEDRQLLLDALLAAGDRLIVTYGGRDERTNTPRPPAVPVGELLDVIDRTVRVEDGEARERVVTQHPLQPFDPRNFTAGKLVPGAPWSFDRITLRGAETLAADRATPAPFLPGPLPVLDAPLVELDDLVRFVRHPVRGFLRRRLGVSVADFTDEIVDSLPVELDGLGEWGVGDRLLEACLEGVDRRAAVLAEIARGTLPPGVLGKPVIEKVVPTVDQLVAAARAVVPDGAEPASVDVRVALPDGRLLSGTVAGVIGDVLRSANYSRVGPKHRLEAWVKLLALTAARPERPFEAATIGRAERGPGIAVARIAPLGADPGARREQALAHLGTLLDLHDRGMREPLPLYCATSAAYARAARAGVSRPVEAARKEWESGFDFEREDAELEHLLVLGAVVDFDDLLAEPPRPDEAGEGWDATETTRFGRCARRLWDGLLALEEVTRP